MCGQIVPDFCTIRHGSGPAKHENLPSLEEWFSLLKRRHPTKGTIPETTTHPTCDTKFLVHPPTPDVFKTNTNLDKFEKYQLFEREPPNGRQARNPTG